MKELDLSDITLFSNYLKDSGQNFNDIHIPYLICSPTHIYKDSEFSKKNDALVPVIILVKKEDTAYHFEEVVFSWNTIDLLQTYSRVHASGQLQYLGDTELYYKLFDEEEIEVKINEVKEITLPNVVENHKYYHRLPPNLLEKYRHEKFLMFSDGNKNYIVPAVEVVRYFYCLSESDSLKEAVFHPSGLGSLVKEVVKYPKSNRQDLHLETICETVDHKKVFYFQNTEKYLRMFNSIFFNYKKDGVIKCQFPANENFKVVCKTLKLPQSSKDTYLITRFVATDLFNGFLEKDDIDLHVFHPISKKKEDKTGKRDPKKDKKTKVPKKKPKNFNDKLSTSAAIPPQIIEDNPNKEYFPDKDRKAKIEKSGKRKERGGHIVPVPIDVSDSSTRDGKGDTKVTTQKVATSNKRSEIEDYPGEIESTTTKEINDSTKIIQEFKLQGFDIESIGVFDFPDKSEFQKRVISYTDKDMQNKRKYIVLNLIKLNKKYIYLDVEPKKDKKEILILKSQTEEIAHKCVYQQVYYGNHKWLVKESLGLDEEIDYIRIRHSTTAKLLVNNIIDKVNN
ncbi:MAG: hypothetical protein LHW46_06495 [Candidatus Cloacimonetes bacterium]|nr:hypothetical protein [Candidatus Cloacimonadota bacterium]